MYLCSSVVRAAYGLTRLCGNGMAELRNGGISNYIMEGVGSVTPVSSIRSEPVHPDKSEVGCRMSHAQVIELAGRWYGLTMVKLKEFNGYDDRNFHLEVEMDARNTNIMEVCPHGYTLKIVNSEDSKNLEFIDCQSRLLMHLNTKLPGYFPIPVKNVEGRLVSLESVVNDGKVTKHAVRLLSFVPGQTIYEISHPNYDIFHQAGEFLGRMDIAMKDFADASLDERCTVWNMSQVPKVRDYLHILHDSKKRELAERILTAFHDDVLPNLDKLSKGTILADFNDHNVIYAQQSSSEERNYQLSGVIDFGDVTHSCYLFEIGIALKDLVTSCKDLDFIKAGGHVLSGVLNHVTLSDLELDLLKTVVSARYIQSLVLSEYDYQRNKDDYFLVDNQVGWEQIVTLWPIPKDILMKKWMEVRT